MAKAKKTSKKGDARFFQTTKKGEIHELKADLNSSDRDRVKEAVKKVIAAMTVGKDVSMLFTDVVKSMQTEDIELKKLVYLYIINYARTQPDKAILVVNTFQKDAVDRSPLVRALAIRTMGCIRVDRITEYLCEPLRQALKDSDPYVRKTAAICTAKLYDINAELVEEQDFLEHLRDMIGDPNPMVVANAVAALAEISEASGKDVFHISGATLQKLLAALNECTEWGQVFLLDALAKYEPTPAEAATIVERVIPRLQHANSAVAMSAVKVIMKYLNIVEDADLVQMVVRQKLPPPLITLLSEHKPEIQYVSLRNINLIVQQRPEILESEVKHFFCKYNDPIYVKMEKLEIMIKLASNDNVEQVLMEFKEYATEVDVEFVRRSVRAIGRCAIKLSRAAERCIRVLLDLIQTKVNYVVQEAIVVIKDIFRKYPNKYESIIAKLCENLDTLDEPEAKASMIWIIGEYAARIENAPELLETFVDTFEDEAASVQLQILTATVKLFLRRPDDAKNMVTTVLNMATDNSDNPDLRDRGYVYWRLLATDPEAAQKVVLADKPVIRDDTHQLDPELLQLLISNISTLASVYHKAPETFVKDGRTFVFKKAANPGDDDDDDSSSSSSDSDSDSDSSDSDSDSGSGSDSDSDDDGASARKAKKKASSKKPQAGGSVDLLDMGLDMSMPSMDAGGAAAAPSSVRRRIVLTAAKGNGLQISMGWTRQGGRPALDLVFQNQSRQPISNFALKFNKNTLQLSPAGGIAPSSTQPGGQYQVTLPLQSAAGVDETAKAGVVQMAIKTELGVSYFQDTTGAYALFEEGGPMPKPDFLQLWKSLVDEGSELVQSSSVTTGSDLTAVAEANNIGVVAVRQVAGKGDVVYTSMRIKDAAVLAELTVPGDSSVRVCVKSSSPVLRQAVLTALVQLFE